MKKFILESRINKANGQINFQLKKNSLPKKIKDKLPKLKGINITLNDLDFDV